MGENWEKIERIFPKSATFFSKSATFFFKSATFLQERVPEVPSSFPYMVIRYYGSELPTKCSKGHDL